MKNIKLNEEIYRMSELMGVSKKILLENTNPVLRLFGLSKAGRELGEKIRNIFTQKKVDTRNSNIIDFGNVRFDKTKPIDDEFLTIVDELELEGLDASNFYEKLGGLPITKEEKNRFLRRLGQVIASNDTDGKVANKIMSELVSELKTQIPEFKTKTDEQIIQMISIEIFRRENAGEKFDEILFDIFTDENGNSYTEIIEVLRDKLKSNVDSLPQDLKDAIKGNLKVSSWSDLLQSIFPMTTLKVQYFINLFKKQDTIRKNIEDRLKVVYTKLNAPVLTGEMAKSIGDDLTLILNNLVSLKKFGAENPTEDFKKYLVDNKAIKDTSEFKSWLKDHPEVDTILNNYTSSTSKNINLGISSIITSRIEALLPVKVFKPFTTNVEELSKQVTETGWERWRRRNTNKLLTGDVLSAREVRILRATSGSFGYGVDKVVDILAITPAIYWLIDLLYDASIGNQDNINLKIAYESLYKELCESEPKPTDSDTISKCDEIKENLKNLKAEVDLTWTETLKKQIPTSYYDTKLGKITELTPTELDNYTAWIIENLLIPQGRTLEGLSVEDLYKKFVNDFSEGNEEIKKILENIDDPDQVKIKMKEYADNLKEQSDGLFSKLRYEPYNTFNKEFPKFTGWTKSLSWVFTDDGNRLSVDRFTDNTNFKAQKFEDGWKWVFPETVENQPLGDGSDPTKKTKTETTTGKESATDDTEETTTGDGNLSKDDMINLGLPQAFYDNRIKRYRGTVRKISDDELVYTSISEKTKGDYRIKNIDGVWYWGGNKENPVVETKIIKQKNMKTLNESIREKLTSKYIDKSKKFIKITENLEKVYPFFEEENYDVFFKKMFKLAESFKKSKLYINEADEELFSKGLSLLSGQEDTIKEKLVNHIATSLSLSDKMKSYVKDGIDSVPNNELGSLFTSPRKIADMVVDAVVDQARESKTNTTDVMSAIESSTVAYFETSEFRRKLVREIQNLIGPKMDEKKGKITQIVRDLLKKSQEN